MRAAVVVAALVLSAACTSARGDEPSDSFDGAIALEGAGRFEDAADALERFAATHPGDALAADALIEAATLRDGRLHDPARALGDWKIVTTRYSDRRGADRAAARVRELEAQLAGTDAATLATFLRMLDEAGAHATRRQRDGIRTFLAAHPGFPLTGDAHARLGRAAEQTGDLDEAQHEYDEAIATPGAHAVTTARDRASLLLRRGRLDEASIAYTALERIDDPIARQAAATGTRAVDIVRRRSRWATAAFIALLVLAVLGLVRARGALWPPPADVRFFSPVALLFALAVLALHRPIAGTVGIIAAGSTLALWIGAGARERASSATARALGAALTMVAVVAIVYAAIYETSLVDLVVETLRAGPDAS